MKRVALRQDSLVSDAAERLSARSAATGGKLAATARCEIPCRQKARAS